METIMQPNDFIEANRKMWNETADIHAQVHGSNLLERVKAPDFSTFDEIETRIFAEIGLTDKAVIQLGCNNGRELISVKKAGAGRCVGIDVSDKFIAQAQQLASVGDAEVKVLMASSTWSMSRSAYWAGSPIWTRSSGLCHACSKPTGSSSSTKCTRS
jgi:hypothetical protein